MKAMTPEQENAIQAAVNNYHNMREESRRLRPQHVKADKALADAWDEYLRALKTIGLDNNLIDNLFNSVLASGVNKSTDELMNDWLRSIRTEKPLH